MNTLDNQEIFRDKKRGVRGIGAAARLRLRKFEDRDTETEFAVPEKIVYGPYPPGFKKVIMNWAWNGQKHLFRTPDGDEWVPDRTDVGRHGGRWEDTKDGKLLNAFFDNLPTGASTNPNPRSAHFFAISSVSIGKIVLISIKRESYNEQ